MHRATNRYGCLPAGSRPAWADYWLGRRRRRKGRYDAFTLVCLRRAWRKRPCLRTLLGYLGCRRDLGYPPSRPLLEHLAGLTPGTTGRDLHRAVNLLLEGGHALPRGTATGAAALRSLASSSPPLAQALALSGQPLEVTTRALAHLQAMQAPWRQAFADGLADVRGSICVVGNAGTLANAGLGPRIDAQRCVVRFNRFHSASSRSEDTGKRIDVWTCSPDLAGTVRPADSPADWVVLSGCDVRYQLYHWQGLLPLLTSGCKVLTIPREVWRTLVRRLHAPPSAGVLLLAWLIELQGDATGITVAGFQTDRRPADANRGYHHAWPGRRAGRRHNWPGERSLLRHWQTQGLTALESS